MNSRAQAWHDPIDVEEALDRSLKALQLEYGKKAIDELVDAKSRANDLVCNG